MLHIILRGSARNHVTTLTNHTWNRRSIVDRFTSFQNETSLTFEYMVIIWDGGARKKTVIQNSLENGTGNDESPGYSKQNCLRNKNTCLSSLAVDSNERNWWLLYSYACMRLKPQSHQACDQVTTYLRPKNGPIVERTYDWWQRSYDWWQRWWVIARGKSVATRS